MCLNTHGHIILTISFIFVITAIIHAIAQLCLINTPGHGYTIVLALRTGCGGWDWNKGALRFTPWLKGAKGKPGYKFPLYMA